MICHCKIETRILVMNSAPEIFRSCRFLSSEVALSGSTDRSLSHLKLD